MTLNGKGKGSAPVCWDCKERIGLKVEWKRFEPAVVAPPEGVVVCGPSCKMTPPGRTVFRPEELLSGSGSGF